MLYRAKKSVAFVEAALARLSEEERLVLELMYINRRAGPLAVCARSCTLRMSAASTSEPTKLSNA